MKRSLVLLLGACMGALAGCSPGALSDLDERTQANFVNGDFEAGTLSAWTTTTRLNNGIAKVPPTKYSDLALQNGGNDFTKVVSGATTESVYANGLAGTDTLKYPRFGTYSAVVNEKGQNNNANELVQSLTTTNSDIDPSDNKIHVRFVLAPVFFDGGHAPNQQPYYYLELRNSTKGTQLFSSFNYAAQAGVPYKKSAANVSFLYTDWQLFDVPFDSAALTVGDTVVVDIVAAGCSLGGHWGELYIDGFGTYIPSLTVAGSAPATVLAGSNLTYTFQVNNGGAAASGVVVTDTLPAGTTFVSVNGLPTGASCTTPAIGGTGNVSCSLGSLANAANTSFQITVNVNQTATGSVNNGTYNVSGTGISPLIGPLVTTTIIPTYLITATVSGGNGTLTCQSPVAAGSNSV